MPNEENTEDQALPSPPGGHGNAAGRSKRQWVAEVRTSKGARMIGPFDGFEEARWFGSALLTGDNLVVLRELIRPDRLTDPGLAAPAIRPLPPTPA